MMTPPTEEKGEKKPKEPGQPKKKRKSAVFDADGNEVLISLMCAKCRTLKPLAAFGLRKMPDGAIRNQPWCRTCRGATGAAKKRATEELPAVAESLPVAAEPIAAQGIQAQPIATPPTVTQELVAQPIGGQPIAGQSIASQPAAAQPIVPVTALAGVSAPVDEDREVTLPSATPVRETSS